MSYEPQRAICRSCNKSDLKNVLSLGRTPLANSLLTEAQLTSPEPTYPLDLAFCPNCSLLQILENVSPDQLFREYLYFSSFSDTMLLHAQQIAERLVQSRNLNADSLVVEIASNDGYLLQFYQQAGVPVLGIEPARNVAQVAEQQRHIPTLCEFFDYALAQQLRHEGKQADIIHANNVLAHVPDLNGFVSGIGYLLKDDGLAVIEVPYAKDMLDGGEFDTIYHEHLSYFSLTALNSLFERHNLVISEVEHLPIHGGSLRLFVGKKTAAQEVGASVETMLQQEATAGMKEFAFYQHFARRVNELKTALTNLLTSLKHEGKRIAAYGAAAKGSTLLNFFGIGREILDFVVDRSTYKQGHFMPGVHLPIYPPQKLLAAQPDYVLLLTWNFAAEIIAQQAEYQQRGGKFIIPIPELKVV